MRKLFTFLTVLTLWATNTNAQSVATIGTGTSNSTMVFPIYRPAMVSDADVSMSVMLFTADELAGAGINNGDTITQLAWNKSNSFGTTGAATFRILMKNSLLPTFSLGNNWGQYTTGMDTVLNNYAQNIPASSGWIPFPLTRKFVYTGGSLEIALFWDIMAVPGNPTTGAFNWRFSNTSNYSQLGNIGDGILSVLGDWTIMTDTYGGKRRSNIQITYTPSPACSGTPTPGNTLASANPACSGAKFILSLENYIGSAATYQWQSSPDGNDPWTNLGTAAAINTSQTTEKYYRCVVSCGGNTAISSPLKVAMAPFYNCYCNAAVMFTDMEDIVNVSIGTLNNTSDCSTTGPGPGSLLNKYSNYCAFLPEPDLKRTATYPFSVSNTDCSGSANVSGLKIYFDYNRNMSFTDSGEEVFVSAPISGYSPPYTFTGNITIPATAKPGQIVMRVMNWSTNYVPQISPCTQYFRGEVEDYLVNIMDAPTVVTSAATNISHSDARLRGTINANSSPTDAFFEWGLTNAYGNVVAATPGSVTGTTTTNISFDLTGLLPGTTYYYRAKGVNSVGTVYGSEMSFTTATPLSGVSGVVTDVTGCFGNTNGAISTTVTGGVAPLTYLWSNGSTTASLTNIGGGDYSLTVTDATSATVTGNWTVNQPSEIVLSAQVTATSCPTSNNGAIDLTVTGGTPTYTYLWSNGSTTEDLTGLAAGEYAVTLTDGNGCTKTGSWTVAQTSPVCDNISVSGTVTTTVCYNALNTITVAGDPAIFTVEAPNGNATFIAGEKVLLLPGTTVQSGAYLLAYISNTYCTNPTMPIPLSAIQEEKPANMMTSAGFKIYPNPTTGTFTLEFTGSEPVENSSAFICDIRGNKILDIHLSGTNKQVISLENQPKGMYFIRILTEKHTESSKILKQ